MQRLHRQVGKHKKRSADEADVATILQEFAVADGLLDSFMDAVRAFQTSWRAILTSQLHAAIHFEALYYPIFEAESNNNTESDPALQEKATQLKTYYAELDNDLQQETSWIQTKLLAPAMDAKQSIAPIKKQVKKRENYKLDYERYSAKVESLKAKQRSPKDDLTLAKYETDLNQGLLAYQNADDQIRRSVPAVIDTIQALIPLLLKTQIMLQHALVGQLYTVTHEYCQHMGIPSPSPPMDQVVAVWDREFTPLRLEAEKGLSLLANGKAVHQPMRIEERKSYTGLGLRSKVPGLPAGMKEKVPGLKGSNKANPPQIEQAPSQQAIGWEAHADEQPGRPRIASSMSLQSFQSVPEDGDIPPQKPPRPGAAPAIPSSSKPRNSSQLTVPGNGIPQAGMAPQVGLGIDDHGSRRSSTSSTVLARPEFAGHGRSPSTGSVVSSIAGKKKPPPPPVKRRITTQDVYVTALYPFAGQGPDDLVFQEGDRIKVLKKTESSQDWWTGELRGVSGQFPANYVQ